MECTSIMVGMAMRYDDCADENTGDAFLLHVVASEGRWVNHYASPIHPKDVATRRSLRIKTVALFYFIIIDVRNQGQSLRSQEE